MLKIGTDCSGIEAPIEALLQMGIPFDHVFACDADRFVRESIKANYTPGILYEDILTRDHSQLPDIDMYVCGFPCQSFSLLGKKLGTSDPRGGIKEQCVRVIEIKQPKIFILENVKNFKFIEKGVPFKELITTLESLGSSGYYIYADIYNTKDYGIPQNRERIYIIGIRKDIQKEPYQVPEKIQMQPLEEFIIDNNLPKINPSPSLQRNINKIPHNDLTSNYIVIYGYYFPMKNICPTITTHCKYYYYTKFQRYLTIKECLSLQGFRTNFKKVVSDIQMYKQVGNSMSPNVLKRIMGNIFKVSNLN